MSEVFLPSVRALLARGVVIHGPSSVYVDPDINPDRIAPGVEIHAGCRLLGATTSIGPDSVLGAETPVTVEDCQLGRGVELKGGYLSGACLLDGASMGSGAHVRSGTLLEEEAGGAHAVGFKQTILLPFVTCGSLINFCDVLMAGGRSRKQHGEVGSSYIHFNFTPHQDKATASLIGDVPRGVFLDQPPVFLGGQGGLVGPARLGFGTVIPAGSILREDVLEDGQLVQPRALPQAGSRPYEATAYRGIRRKVANCLVYLGNIRALRCWYLSVRRAYLTHTPHGEACYSGALRQLKAVEAERIKRLGEFAEKLKASIAILRKEAVSAQACFLAEQESFLAAWPDISRQLHEDVCEGAGAADRDAILSAISHMSHGAGYLDMIRALSPEARLAGTRWLKAVVDTVSTAWQPPNP